MRILLVEDEKDFASILRQGLEEKGHNVSVAHDAEAALLEAGCCSFDLFIMDIILPRMDGLTALANLRKKNISSPAIIITARVELAGELKGIGMGIDSCLIKPFAFSELLEEIDCVVERFKVKQRERAPELSP
ncbi:MAG: response regulator [Deltaproteobacteria bacterium]|nr:response regulator [Deltaproteobacteria bacterium]